MVGARTVGAAEFSGKTHHVVDWRRGALTPRGITSETSNIDVERPTSISENWKFDVGRWMLSVRCPDNPAG